MGRRKKYVTEEQRREANNRKAMKYYLENVEEVRAKNLRKYHEEKVKMSGSGSI